MRCSLVICFRGPREREFLSQGPVGAAEWRGNRTAGDRNCYQSYQSTTTNEEKGVANPELPRPPPRTYKPLGSDIILSHPQRRKAHKNGSQSLARSSGTNPPPGTRESPSELDPSPTPQTSDPSCRTASSVRVPRGGTDAT